MRAVYEAEAEAEDGDGDGRDVSGRVVYCRDVCSRDVCGRDVYGRGNNEAGWSRRLTRPAGAAIPLIAFGPRPARAPR